MRSPTLPSLLRRTAVLLPIVVLATALPVMRGEVKPRVRQWAVPLERGTVVSSPDEFALLGVSVPGAGDVPKSAMVRASRDGKRWTRWTEIEFETEVGPDLGSHESGSHTSMPVWTGRNRYVDVRFPEGRPRGTRVHLVDPGPDPSAPPSSAMASPSKPGIVTRAGWGADESIRRGKPSYAEPLKLAIIHHTATADSYASSESDDIVRGIYAYHVNTNGWDDIGYNFLVDRYGKVFEGRYGGITRTVVGAHAQGFNKHSTGISMIGNFASSKPPEVAMQALKRITSWRLDQGTVDPTKGVTYTSGGSNKYPAGQKVSLKNVSAHLDVGQTACPGGPIYGALGWLRSAAYSDGLPKLFDAKVSRGAITPNGDGISDGVRLTGRFSQTTSWRADVLDVGGNVMSTLNGSGTTVNFPWYGKDRNGKLVRHGPYRFKVTGKNSKGTLRAYYVGFNVYNWPNGTLFATEPSGGRYILEKNKMRPVSSWQSRATRYRGEEYVYVPDSVRSYYGSGSMIGFREGSLVKLGDQVYVISAGKKRPTTTSVLRSKGYDTDAIIATDSAALRPHATGTTLTSSSTYPTGATLRSTTGTAAWLTGTIAKHFFNGKARSSYVIRNVDLAGPADSTVATGAGEAPIGFRDGTLVQLTGSRTVYVISDGKRRQISSTSTFQRMGYDTDNIVQVTAAELALHDPGTPV